MHRYSNSIVDGGIPSLPYYHHTCLKSIMTVVCSMWRRIVLKAAGRGVAVSRSAKSLSDFPPSFHRTFAPRFSRATIRISRTTLSAITVRQMATFTNEATLGTPSLVNAKRYQYPGNATPLSPGTTTVNVFPLCDVGASAMRR